MKSEDIKVCVQQSDGRL